MVNLRVDGYTETVNTLTTQKNQQPTEKSTKNKI